MLRDALMSASRASVSRSSGSRSVTAAPARSPLRRRCPAARPARGPAGGTGPAPAPRPAPSRPLPRALLLNGAERAASRGEANPGPWSRTVNATYRRRASLRDESADPSRRPAYFAALSTRLNRICSTTPTSVSSDASPRPASTRALQLHRRLRRRARPAAARTRSTSAARRRALGAPRLAAALQPGVGQHVFDQVGQPLGLGPQRLQIFAPPLGRWAPCRGPASRRTCETW